MQFRTENYSSREPIIIPVGKTRSWGWPREQEQKNAKRSPLFYSFEQ